MSGCDVLVIAPFRRPVFRTAISPLYPIEEPWDSPPLLIAGALENAGLSVGYLPLQNIYTGFDEDRDLPGLRRLLDEHRAPLVVFAADHFIASRSTATLYGIRLISGLLKARAPAPAIGVVGRLATTTRARLLELAPHVDFVTVGEVDQVIGAIALELLCGKEEARDLGPHVITRAQADAADVREVVPARLDDLNAQPLPAFHLLGPSVELLARQRRGMPRSIPFSLRTSLGCRFQCRFCAGVPHWRQYRLKSPDRVAAEVDHLERSVGGLARLSFLEDEIFTASLDHVRGVTAVLEERGVRLDGLYTHSALLTPEAATLLKPITRRVFLGLDNPDDRVLKEMRKGQRLSTVLDAVAIARDAGLEVHLEWIIGTPHETVDTLTTSLGTIFSLLSTGAVESINTYVYCPHPGTEYAENAELYDLRIHGDFEEMQESGGYPSASTPRLSRNQIFSTYLMSQLMISEVLRHRESAGPLLHAENTRRAELRRLIEQIGQQ